MSKKLTTDEFIEKAKKIHGDKYDYSLVEYINCRIKVEIICPKHGVFKQNPHSHLQNHGCPYCGESKKLTTEEFIEKSKKVHGDKYDYSLVKYKTNHNKVKIICPKHGEFNQSPNSHLRKSDCPKCSGNIKLSPEKFVEKAKKIHGDKYDYSLVKYKNTHNKIKIICHIHGIFEQNLYNHYKGGNCPKCVGKILFTKEIFIEKSKNVHGDKYNYSKVFYKNNNTKVKIICQIHGEFEQTPVSHYGGSGCPKCSGKNKTTKDIIDEFKKVHGCEYDYSLTEYINSKTKIKIICPKHGIFLQLSDNHKHGNGCPICLKSRGEMKISRILERHKIEFIREYKFNDCKYKQKLPFDFYLPEYNTCIGEKSFEKNKIRDQIKNEYCKNNNIKLIRIKFDDDINDKLIDLFKT